MLAQHICFHHAAPVTGICIVIGRGGMRCFDLDAGPRMQWLVLFVMCFGTRYDIGLTSVLKHLVNSAVRDAIFFG